MTRPSTHASQQSIAPRPAPWLPTTASIRPLLRATRRVQPGLKSRFPLSLRVYVGVLLLLFFLHTQATSSNKPMSLSPFPLNPPPFVGTPASHFPLHSARPHVYFSSNARFMLYTAAYGQFNNQIVSLVHALLMARHADAVLVLPYTRMGKESKWDSAFRNITQTDLIPYPELVGHYFNYSHLLSSNHIVRASHFFASSDGHALLDLPNVTTAFKSGGYYRRLLRFASINFLSRHRSRVVVLASPHPKVHLHHICDLNPHTALATARQQGRNGRFTLLPVVFRRHNLNCTMDERDWLEVRRRLVPRDEHLHAVDRFLQSIPQPVFSLHLRMFLNGDVGNFTSMSFVDMLFRDYGAQLKQCKSIYVAYSPSSVESRDAVRLLRKRFHGVVADGSDHSSFYAPRDHMYSTLALAPVLFDMWVCVKSRLFLGRLGSSLSWNVVYWRQTLWWEYGLDMDVVEEPLWYVLSNFTTTGARRNEGNRLGSRFITD